MAGNVRVDGSEVALNTPNLLLKYLVPEARLKFALACRGRRHTHRFLTTTQENLSR